MKTRPSLGQLNLGLVVPLLLGMGYLGLILFLGTSSPFLLTRGASMEPTLHSGDLLLQRSVPAKEIQAGDIIAFRVPPDAQQRLRLPSNVVHRVLRVEGEKGKLVFVTKGDNSDIDPFKVSSSAVRGLMVKNLGPIGRPILFLTNKGVLLALGLPIVIFGVIVVAALKLPTKESPREPPREPPSSVTQPPTDVEDALNRLTSAVAEHGVRLQSHTATVRRLGGTSEGLDAAVKQQAGILTDLAAMVRELKEETRRHSNRSEPHAPGNIVRARPLRNKTRVEGPLRFAPNESRERRVSASAGVPETLPSEMENAVDRLASTVSEFREHLQAHTDVVKTLGGASEGLDRAVKQQNVFLTDLALIFRDLAGESTQNAYGLEAHASGNVTHAKTPGNDAKAKDLRDASDADSPRSGADTDSPPDGTEAEALGIVAEAEAPLNVIDAQPSENGHEESFGGFVLRGPQSRSSIEEQARALVVEMEARIIRAEKLNAASS